MRNRALQALIVDSKNDQSKTLRILLENEADVHAKDRAGWTAFHWAVKEGDLDIIKLLLKYLAVLEVRDTNGWTPFYIAAFYGQKDIAEFLLAEGANPTAESYNLCTPLHLCGEQLFIGVSRSQAPAWGRQ